MGDRRRFWCTGKLAAAALCAILSVSQSGCSYGNIALKAADTKTEISLSWWGTDVRHDYTMEAVKQFEELHPDIDVKMQYTEWSGYDKKTAIQMASHTEADVMQINYSWLSKFSPDGNGYYDLNKLKANLNLSSFDDTQLGYGTAGGTLNGLAIALNSKVCLYNKDIYASYNLAYPKTWDELIAAAHVMQKDGIYPFDLDKACAFMFSAAYVEQQTGKSFFSEDGSLNFDRQDARDMLSFYMNLVNEKVCPFVEERDENNYKNGVCAGSAQWITSAGSFESGLLETKGQATAVETNFTMEGAKRSGWYVKPASFYTISKHTDHPQEAAMLLDFLVNGPEMARLQGLEKGIPVSKSARDALNSAGMFQGIQVEAEEAMYASDVNQMNPRFEDAGLQDAFSKAASSIKYDGVSLDEAAGIAMDGFREDLK